MDRMFGGFGWVVRGVLVWLALGLSGGELVERAEAQTKIVPCLGSPLVTLDERWDIDLEAQTCSYVSQSYYDRSGEFFTFGLGTHESTPSKPDPHVAYDIPSDLQNVTCLLVTQSESGLGSEECSDDEDFGYVHDGFRASATYISFRDSTTAALIADFDIDIELVDYGTFDRSELSISNGITFYTTDAPEVTSVNFQDGAGNAVTSVGPGESFRVQVSFDEAMDAAAPPDLKYFTGLIGTGSEVDLSAWFAGGAWSTGNSVYTATYTAPSSLSGAISIASTRISGIDGAGGNTGLDYAENDTLIIGERPTIALSADKTTLRSGDSATLTFTLSAESNDFGLSSITVPSGTTLSNFAQDSLDARIYTATYGAPVDVDADITFSVASGAFTSLLGIANTDGDDANNKVTLSVDTIVPTVSVTRDDPNPPATTTASVAFSVEFSEVVQNVDADDFALALTGTATGDADVNVSGSGASYTVTVTGLGGSGDLGLDLITSLQNITDLAGNAINTSPTVNEAYQIGFTGPTFTITRDEASPTRASSLNFSVNFSQTVLNVDANDFVIETTGDVGGNSVVGVSGSGTDYTVTVDTVTGTAGTLGLALSDSHDITDSSGSQAPFAAPTTNEVYDIDSVAPVLTFPDAPAVINTTDQLTLTLQWSEPAYNFGLSDVQVTNGNADSLQSSNPSQQDTLNITPDGLGDVIITIPEGAANDGNPLNRNALTTRTIRYNTQAPTLNSIKRYQALSDVTNASSVTFRLIFSEEVQRDTFTKEDLKLYDPGDAFSGASIGDPQLDVFLNSWTVTVSNISGDGALGLSMASGAFITSARAGTAAFVLTDPEGTNYETYTIDQTDPIARAGTDQTVDSAATGVELDGSGSSDANDIASHEWLQVDGDASSTPASTNTVTLDDASAEMPKFDAPTVATDTALYFRLTVTDEAGNTDTDWVTVTVGAPAAGPASVDTSEITASTDELLADSATTATITVRLKDANGISLTSGGDTVALSTSLGSLGTVEDKGNGTYTATLKSSNVLGTATITGTLGSTAIVDTAEVEFTPGATLTSIKRESPTDDVTKATAVTFELTFDAEIDGAYMGSDLGWGQFQLVKDPTNAFSAATIGAPVEGSTSATWTVTVSGLTGDGTLGLSLANAELYDDNNGAPVEVTDPSGVNNETYTIDQTDPSASAGDDQTVDSAAADVALDGSGSSDTNGIASYEWLQVVAEDSDTAPTENLVTLDTATDPVKPTFDAPAVSTETTLHFKLTVTDKAGNTDDDWVTVTVSPPSATPTLTSIKRETPTIADTNADMVTFELVFSADVSSGSFTSQDLKLYDSGDTFSSGPSIGEPQQGSSADTWTVTVSSISDDGELGLDFSDTAEIKDAGDTAFDLTRPTGTNYQTYEIDQTDPTANAGADSTTVSYAIRVALDGSGSSDANDIASYTWLQVDGATSNTPVTNPVTLDATDPAMPTFTAPAVSAETTLHFKLTVTDKAGNTDDDWVTVTVSPPSATGPEIAISRDGTDLADGDPEDLGYVATGVEQTLTYTIKNDGDADLVLDQVNVNNTNNVNVALGVLIDPTIAPNESKTMVIRVTPDSDGAFSFDLVFDNNDDDESEFDLTVSGTAAPASSLVPEITVTRDSQNLKDGDSDLVDFAGTGVPRTLTYTVKNSGKADLELSAFSTQIFENISGTISVPTSPITVSADATETFDVTFTTNSDGVFDFDLVIENNDIDENPFTLTVAGPSVPASNLVPEIAISRGTAGTLSDGGTDALGDIATGVEKTLTYTVENTGKADLELSAFSTQIVENIRGTITVPSSAITISAGAKKTFEVKFTPNSDGAFSFDLDIDNNDSDEDPFELTVSGTAVTASMTAPEITVSRNGISLDDGEDDVLGSVTVGAPFTLTYSVENEGNADLTLTAFSISNTDNIRGTITVPSSSFTIAAGQTETFDVTFTPDRDDTFSFDVAIENNDDDEDPFNLTVKGSAQPASSTAPEIAVSRGTDTFIDDDTDALDYIATGAIHTLTYTIENEGTGDLLIADAYANNLNNIRYPIVPTFPSNIAGGQSAAMTVWVVPDTDGPFSFDLYIDSNDDESPFKLTVSGAAAPASSLVPDITVTRGTAGTLTDGGNDALGNITTGVAQTLTYTVKNDGKADLELTDFLVGSASNISGSIAVPTSSITIPADATQTFDVTFTPNGDGPFSFELEIENNDSDENPFDLYISGDAVTADTTAPSADPVALASGNALSAGLARAGDMVTLSFTVDEVLATNTPQVSLSDTDGTELASGDASAVGTSGLDWAFSYTVQASDADGAISFTLDLKDDDGNEATQITALINDPDGQGVTIDNTEPRPTIDLLTTNDTTPALSGTVDDPNASLTVSVDGQTISSVTVNGTAWAVADNTLTALAEGTYDIVVTATDAAGNVGTDESSDELVIDLTGPKLTTVAIQSDNAKDTSLAKVGDTITLRFVSDVDLGQTPTVTIDGQSTSVSTAGARAYQASHAVDASTSEGPVAFEISGLVDSVGNTGADVVSAIGGSSVTVDRTAPSVLAVTPDPATIGTSGPFKLTVTFSESMDTSKLATLGFDKDPTAVLTAQANGAAWSMTSESNDTYAVTYDVTDAGVNLADIGVSFAASFEDPAGNAMTSANSEADVFDIVQDTEPPTIALSADKDVVGGGETATITFTMSEPVTGFDLSDVLVSGGTLDGFDGSDADYSAIFTPDAGSTTDAVISVDSNRFTDLIGLANVDGNDAGNTVTLTIDTVLPVLTEVTAIATPGNDATPSYTFASTKPGDITYAGPCTSGTDTQAVIGDNTVTFDALADGTYESCALTVTDTMGNSSAPLTLSAFTVDATAPAVSAITWTPNTVTNAIDVSVAFSEPVSGFDTDTGLALSHATATVASEIEPIDGTTYAFSITPDADFDGLIELQVVADAASDAAGNFNTASEVVEIQVDTLSPTVTLTAAQTELGMDETTLVRFTLSEPSTTFSAADVSVTGGTLSDFTGSGSEYSATFTPAFGQVTVAGVGTLYVAAGSFDDENGNGNLASDVLEIDFSGAIIERTSYIIQNFITRRADQITASEPDLSRRLQRSGGSDQTAGNWSGGGDGRTSNQMSFTTSLTQIRAWQQRDKRAPNMEDGDHLLFGARPFAQTHGSFPADIWLSGSVARTDNEFTTSALGLLHGGIDFAVNDGLVLGMMGQLDWVDEENETEDFSASGFGWMAGPYLVAKVKDDLVVDARIAWGQSDNDVSPFDSYEDEFETERMLVSGKVTGSVQLSKVNLSPQLGLIYFEETQLGYDDANGLYIPSQDVSLGRLTFSPNLSQSWALEDGSSFALNWTLKGIWDFDTADLANIDTGLLARRDTNLRARTEGGFNLNLVNGMRVQASGFYDGFGARDYASYGGTVTFTIPLSW